MMGCLCQVAFWPGWNFIPEIKADILTPGHCRKLHYPLSPSIHPTVAFPFYKENALMSC